MIAEIIKLQEQNDKSISDMEVNVSLKEAIFLLFK